MAERRNSVGWTANGRRAVRNRERNSRIRARGGNAQHSSLRTAGGNAQHSSLHTGGGNAHHSNPAIDAETCSNVHCSDWNADPDCYADRCRTAKNSINATPVS